MSKPIKLAIFGVGRWGVHLLRHFLADPQVEVVAIADPHSTALNQILQQFSLSNTVLLTPDWQTALQTPQLDAVVVATPAMTHYAIIRAALERSLHVLAEKPLTPNPAECQELCHLAEKQQRHLIVDHTYLFHPVVKRGKAIVKTGLLGELRYGYATRTHLAPVRQDVDVLWDLAIHDLAILNFWLEEVPCQVQAEGTVWLQPHLGTAHTGAHGLADLAWIRLAYPSGFQATIHVAWLNPDKQRRLAIVGSSGTLIFDELARHPLTIAQGELREQDGKFYPDRLGQEILEVPTQEPLKHVCNHFIDCIQANQPSTISPGWLGAELVQILAAISESMQQHGRPIQLPMP